MCSFTHLTLTNFAAHISKLYVNYSDGDFAYIEGGDGTPENEKIFLRANLILAPKKPVADLTIDGEYFRRFTKREDPSLTGDTFKWTDNVALSASSALLKYHLTLNNYTADHQKEYKISQGGRITEDRFTDPVITVKIPALLKIEPTLFQYISYEDSQKPICPLNSDYFSNRGYSTSAYLYWSYRVGHQAEYLSLIHS